MNNLDFIRFEQFVKCMAKDDMPVSRWFYAHELEVYIRMWPASFTRTVPTLVISNISVFNLYQGKGVFGAFVKQIEESSELSFIKILKVENVVNKFLGPSLERRGFAPIPSTEGISCVSYLKNIN